MKKLFAILLAISMIMTVAMTASAKETTLPDLDCTGWWAAHTDGLEVTEEGITITFTNTTYESATGNWNGPLYVLYTANNASLVGYTEYWAQRGDNWGWCGDYNTNNLGDIATYTCEGNADWDNFVANMKAGINGTINAKLDGDKVVVVMEFNGLKTTLTRVIDPNKPVYIALTGELTKLTNIKVEGASDSSAKLESELDCAGWWTNHSEGILLEDKPVTITFTNTTYKDAVNNWNGPLCVLYTADGNHIGTYSEYWVQRADNAGWDGNNNNTWANMDALNAAGITMTSESTDADLWANWMATLKAGCDVKVIAELEGSNVLLTMQTGDLTVKTTVPVDTSKPVYLALSGEMTKLTNIKVTTESGKPAVTPDSDKPTVTPDSSNPKDGDSITVFVALMAVSAAGAVLLTKKKEF